jgi:hypothetical protein
LEEFRLENPAGFLDSRDKKSAGIPALGDEGNFEINFDFYLRGTSSSIVRIT